MVTIDLVRRSCALALGAWVVCGGVGSAAAATPSDDREACSRLADVKVDAGAISLPTTGADVAAAELVEASAAGNRNGAFCRVMGAIKPVDPKAPKILWQVNLPTRWNGKALQMGGGGYNGSIPDTLGKPTLGLDDIPTPLAQGYITFASDSGHQAPNADDASFATNDEAMLNYGYMPSRRSMWPGISRHCGMGRRRNASTSPAGRPAGRKGSRRRRGGRRPTTGS
jgi:hypothetical protein